MELEQIKEALEKALEIFQDHKTTVHIEDDSVFFADGIVQPENEPSPYAGIDKTTVEIERYIFNKGMRKEKVQGYYVWYMEYDSGTYWEPPDQWDVEIVSTEYAKEAIVALIRWLAEQMTENKIYKFFPEY